MSGDSHIHDDDDFLDEDFVVEDIVGKNDELEDLFDEPSAQKRAQGIARREAAPRDEEDTLFMDQSASFQEAAVFEGRGQFSEQATSDWEGESLELEDDEQGAAPAELEDDLEGIGAIGGEMFSGEEDFALDSEAELELVDIGGGEPQQPDEFEQSAAFTLDGDDETWTEETADPAMVDDDLFADEPVFAAGVELGADDAAEFDDIPSTADVLDPYDDESDALEPVLLDASALADEEELEGLPLLDSADEASLAEPGWEPMPRPSVDEPSEVDEVQAADDERVYDTNGYETEEPLEEPAPQTAECQWGLPPEEEPDLEYVEGHDIYAEDEERELVVVGAREPARGLIFGMFVAIAASLAIIGSGALVVLRPQWVGLSFEPERLERVAITRPKVELVVAEPAAPGGEVPPGGNMADEGGGDAAPNDGGNEGPGQPDERLAQQPPPVEPAAETPGEQTTRVEPTVDPVATVPTPGKPGEGTGETPSTGGESTAPGEAPVFVGVAWPVAVATPKRSGEQATSELSRLGDDLMLGGFDPSAAGTGMAVDGVMPGSRAFAQLHNGNFFIGSVKAVGDQSVTLRVETGGEVTLSAEQLAQLTPLGSGDYEELQRATTGTVRLTNNNRLVGGILSRIADDHVVLEFRKNRVMLPKSAVGAIVSGQEESAVRLDTTLEEDNWLRSLIERQIGTGRGAETQEPDAGGRSR